MLDEEFFKEGMSILTKHFNLDLSSERLNAIFERVNNLQENEYQLAIESIVENETQINANVNLNALIRKHLNLARESIARESKRNLIQYKKEDFCSKFRADAPDCNTFEEFYDACCWAAKKQEYVETPNPKFCRMMYDKWMENSNLTYKDIFKKLKIKSL